MKLLYQQMLAFFAVIITVIVVLGFAFIRTTKSMIYQNQWSQLTKYGQSIETNAIRYNLRTHQVVSFNEGFLDNSQALLNNQGTHFTIFNAKKQTVYTNSARNRLSGNVYSPRISNGEWKRLKANKIITKQPRDNFRNRTTHAPANKPQLRTIDVLMPMFYTDPSSGESKFVGAISIGSWESSMVASEQQIENNLFIALLVSGAAALILSYVLARYSVSRISKLRKATHSVAKGDLDIHLESNHKDELDDLADDFNGMVGSLKQSNDEIKRQEQRRREFMADAAHEMRTPLTTINGILEGLAYDAIPEEDKPHSIDLMRNETNRLIRLVNENLDYEKIRTGQMPLHKTEFDGSEVLKNLVEQLTQKAADAGDHFELTVPDQLPVWADYDRFVQVIFNIMQNAIQFSKDSAIEITASHNEHASSFKITDHGIGMTEEQVRNIWERYYKADPSRKNTKYGESGLGMAISHQLVQQHGGSIEVQSQPDQGTTFTVTFPEKGYDQPIKQD